MPNNDAMITLAELNDPVKAEAFLRESIASADQWIATLEARAQREIQEFREQHPNDPIAERRYISGVMDQLEMVIEPIRQNREAMMLVIVRQDTTAASRGEP